MHKIEYKKLKPMLVWILLLVVSIASWLQLELSSVYKDVWDCFSVELKYIILNILTNSTFILIFYIILNRLWLACLVFSSASTLIALVNYYVIRFRGMPLSVMDLGNFRTAMNVLGSYKIRPDIFSVVILLIYLGCCILSFIIKKIEHSAFFVLKKVLLRDLLLVGMCVGFGYIGYISPNAVKPKLTVGWSWEEAYHTYGYMACSLEMIYRTRYIIPEPDGYSVEVLQDMDVPENNGPSITPDIILILNESFYDLTQIADITTDIPFFENISQLKDTDSIVSGYAVVPSAGGGTNAAEYELLTSNSMQLLEGIGTPFNVMKMKNANSIVSHLQQLGYTTLGSHSEPALNYSRGRAYPDMGFDIIHFDEDFVDKEFYENRWYETDECLYRNIINWYNEMPEQLPRFLYLLTIQNHGGWDMNPPESDTVHVSEDYGEYTQIINEYLSSIRLSDIAFKDLTDYFRSVDRPVIICMVGDHSPIFADRIVDVDYTESERSLRLHSTPYIIWSNYEIDKTVPERISMCYLLPTVLDIAGINTSPYYEYMIDLSAIVPVLSDDIFLDDNEAEDAYSSNTDYTDKINRYFYLEYNNLSRDRIQNLFDAYE